MRERFRPWIFVILALALLPLAAGGCARMRHRSPSGALSVRSVDGKNMLAPEYSTAVHIATNVAAGEAYLTDLPVDRLLDSKDNLAGLSGSIVQIRLFIVPRAGSTPISDTGCNFAMRYIVLGSAGEDRPPEVGLYGGGGFLLPDNDPKRNSLSGSMSEVTLRLLGSTVGFFDLLGAAEAQGRFSTRADDKTALGLAERVQSLVQRVEVRPAAQSTSMASPKE